jgi:hypothetical protein
VPDFREQFLVEPILRFADKLLSASQRGGRSIQANGPPVITAPAHTWTALAEGAADST